MFTTSLETCPQDSTFIIEAILEELTMKQDWFEKLDQLCDENVVLMSNTSGLSPTDIAMKA